jgi:hypothetical protein
MEDALSWSDTVVAINQRPEILGTMDRQTGKVLRNGMVLGRLNFSC